MKRISLILFFLALFLAHFSLSAQVRKTMCASGCDYDGTQFQTALNDAQAYQDRTQCKTYILELDPALTMAGNFQLPSKACNKYVIIRSSRMDSLPPQGVRINSAQHARYMPTLQCPLQTNIAVINTAVSSTTAYWRFVGIQIASKAGLFVDYRNNPAQGSGVMTIDSPTAQAGTPWGYITIACAQTACSAAGDPFTVKDTNGQVIGTAQVGTPFTSHLNFTIRSISSPIPAGNGWTLWGDGEYYLIGIGVDVAGNSTSDPRAVPHHIEFERCWIHGFDNQDFPRQGIQANGDNIILRDSILEEIHYTENDAAGVSIINGRGPLYVTNNYITASGQSWFSGDNAPGVLRFLPSFQFIAGNRMERPYKWNVNGGTADPTGACFQDAYYRNVSTNTDFLCNSSSVWASSGTHVYPQRLAYLIKPHLECKFCSGVWIYGNYMDKGWVPHTVFGFGTGQDHTFLVLNQTGNTYGQAPWSRPEDVHMYWNKLDSGLKIIALGTYNGPTPYDTYTNNVYVEHNLATNMVDPRAINGDVSYGRTIGYSYNKDIFVRNNTLLLAPNGYAQKFADVAAGSSTLNGVTEIRNNIASHGVYGIAGAPVYFGGCNILEGAKNVGTAIMTGNLFVDTQASHPGSTAGDLCAGYYLYPRGNSFPSSFAAAVDAANAYKVVPAYRGQGDDGHDPGANMDMVNSLTANAIDGGDNPFLGFRIRSVLQASVAASMYYTAPSLNSCTVDVAVNPLYSTPVGSTVQNRIGRHGQVDIRGLSPNTLYFTRLTCDGIAQETSFLTGP